MSKKPLGPARMLLVILIAVLLFVLVAVSGSGPANDGVGDGEQSTECDGAAERGSWITDRDSSDPDGFSPHAKGFRAVGRCNTKILDKMLSCDPATVRGIHGDNPIMRRARDLGFTTYVCELVGSNERTEFPLAVVLGR